MDRTRRALRWLGLLACLGTWAAHAVPGVDYTLVNHRVDFFTGANVTPVKHGSFAVGPGVQADTLSLIEPAGHSITSVAYTSALGKTGWKVDTASLTGSARYESEASLTYTDAIALGVVGSAPAPAGAMVTLSVKIDGTFAGSTSRGSTGFELTAFNAFAGVALNRVPDPAAPGMDRITRTDTGGGGPQTFFSVASGVAFPFSEILTLTVPVAALGPAVPVLAPTTGIRPFPFARDCLPSPPEIVCMGRLGGPGSGTGPAPLPITFTVTDTLTRAGNPGVAGASVIDQMNTATLSVQMPAGVHFLLESGALNDDPASLFQVLPIVAVPEPGAYLLMAFGLLMIGGRALRRGVPAAVAAACAFCPAGPAAAAIGVDYTLDAIVNDFTAAPIVMQTRDIKTGHLSTAGFGMASASRLDADGFTVGNVSFDPAVGKIGFLAHTLSGTMNKGYLLNSTGTYRDAVSVVTSAAQPVPTQVVLNMTVEGDFGRSANQGAVTMTFSAAGQSSFLQLSRNPAPLNPGFDFYKTWSDFSLPPVSVLVPAGTTQHFTETLSLTVPVTALPAATQAIFTGLPSVGGSPHGSGGCSATHPCGVIANHLTGAAAPVAEFQFEVSLSSSSGHGAQLGESLLDLTHTATLSVQTPNGVHFLLTSGGLAADPQSAFAVLPVVAVPEPSAAVFLLAGLGVLLARRGSSAIRRTTTGPAKETR